ncbi:MAG: MFS transporter [Gammaproteobacteria bacterium]|nr:MFS transporter [Gammaproteobacteria bacterium]
MDASSELVHSLLPLYLANSLGASMAVIGVIEGTAEATAQMVKVFSGVLSDYLGKRKLLAVIGYGMAALSKPIFPLAASVEWVFTARLLDRIGKGIRGAQRDALIAEVTPLTQRGAAFGLRQALDSVGAFIGPLLAIGLMLMLANDLKLALWAAVIPALLSVAVLCFGVAEPAARPLSTGKSILWHAATRLTRRYWWVVALGIVFTLARFSEAFLLLRAHSVGLNLAWAPSVLVVMSVVYAAVAYPAGVAADRLKPRGLLIIGLLFLIAADGVLAIAANPAMVLLGAALWGIHLGLTQGLLSKLVADAAPPDLLGTAFGVFNLMSGIAVLVASVLAGLAWDHYGPAATFALGAAFAAFATLGLAVTRTRRFAA